MPSNLINLLPLEHNYLRVCKKMSLSKVLGSEKQKEMKKTRKSFIQLQSFFQNDECIVNSFKAPNRKTLIISYFLLKKLFCIQYN